MFGSSGSKLSSTARALLAAERDQREDEALKERALQRASATLEGERWSGIALRRTELSAARSRSRRLRLGLLAAAAVAVAGLATAAVRLTAVSTPHPAIALPKLAVPIAANQVEPMHEVPSVVQPQAQPMTSPSAAPVASVISNARSRPMGAGQYAIEVGLLDPARLGIARGDYAAALAAIAKHQREYPSGVLAQEREALRVRALWGSGQRQAAETAAAAFRQRYPRSALLSWLKAPPTP